MKISLLTLVLSLAYCAALAQQTWHLDDTSFRSSAGKKPAIKLGYSGRTTHPELVRGVLGSALRTDGYSVYLSGQLPPSSSGLTNFGGFFALETFPTDTAGFFALRKGRLWLSACVDRFGKLMIGINQSGMINYYPTRQNVKRFKWFHVSLTLIGNNAELLLNDKVVQSVALAASPGTSASDSLIVGRDWRIKCSGELPITFINGLIDELTWSDHPMRNAAHLLTKTSTPVLAVPTGRFKTDFTRPRYHLLPAANWTNETHGLLYYKGIYHLFNQKNGANLFLGQINWGHYSSPDLIRWTEQKPALTPEPGYDENGIWSGCITIDDKSKPLIFYSSGGPQGISVSAAIADDQQLNIWHKYAGNPIIRANPKQFSRDDFHDPIVWKANGCWYMGVGFGLREKGVEAGTILLYKSTDLLHWAYLHQLFTGHPEQDDSGVFWEMPVFWKMNGKYILLVNKVPYKGQPAVSLYWTGDFVNEKFIPDNLQPRRLEVINRLLSPSVGLDSQGSTTAIAIIPDETSARDTYNRGWTHLYSIPRRWTLDSGKILQRPHPALARLRGDGRPITPRRINPSSALLISQSMQQLEIELELLPESAKKFGLYIGKDPQGKEQTRIYFDTEKKQLVVDQTQSSLRRHVPLQVRTGDYIVTPNKPLKLRIFIDGSVVEGFIDDRDAFTTRLFPLNAESTQVELFTESGTINVRRGMTWPIKSSGNKTAF